MIKDLVERFRNCPNCEHPNAKTEELCRWCQMPLPAILEPGDWRLESSEPTDAILLRLSGYIAVSVCLIIPYHTDVYRSESGITIKIITLALATAICAVCIYFSEKISQDAATSVQQRRQRFASEYLKAEVACPMGFALYLRPFAIDGRIFLRRRKTPVSLMLLAGLCYVLVSPLGGIVLFFVFGLGLRRVRDLEEILCNSISHRYPLFATGIPGRIGGGKLESDDMHWRSLVSKLLTEAKVVFVVPGAYEGTIWEVAKISSSPTLLAKTIFVCPVSIQSEQGTKTSANDYWTLAIEVVRERANLELPAYAPDQIFRFNEKGEAEQLGTVKQLGRRATVDHILGTL